MNETKEILLNKMFRGSYIENKTKLAHEIINLFKDDNNRNFIYVQAYGAVANKHCRKDKNGNIKNTIETVLLVKNAGKNKLEIVAKATGLTPLTFIKKSWKQDQVEINKKQLEQIREQKIEYDGIPLNELFSDNKDEIAPIYYTFEAKSVQKVKSPIFITTDKNTADKNTFYLGSKITNFAKQSLKMYIKKSNSPQLCELIENPQYWGKETPLFKDFKIPQKQELNFLKIIHKEDDELVFSCLFEYVFTQQPQVLREFVKKFLKINISETAHIDREKNNIDLLIYDNKKVIVIENKIKSGINGNQLKKYINTVKREKDENGEDNEHYGKSAYFVLFRPDYNNFSIPKTEPEYKLIKYSEIYKFFKSYHHIYNNDFYFAQFFAALEKHTKPSDNSLEEDAYLKLSERVNNAKILKNSK